MRVVKVVTSLPELLVQGSRFIDARLPASDQSTAMRASRQAASRERSIAR
jgi:hypothetical protein